LIPADNSSLLSQWREKQRKEIEAREAAAKQRRQETITNAERAIDDFYEEYSKKKERNIRENKCVPVALTLEAPLTHRVLGFQGHRS